MAHGAGPGNRQPAPQVRLPTWAVLVVFTTALVGLLWLGGRPRPTELVGDATAPSDGCGACHEPVALSGAHAPLGAHCEQCHGGDPAGTTEAAAHEDLEVESGALQTAAQTCGRDGCHPAQLARVEQSLMATGRGLVAVDRFAFGELTEPNGDETLAEVLAAAHPTPAQDHLRKLCAGCHLGTRRANRDDAVVDGGSGCSACHSGMVAEGVHPDVDLVVPDTRCFGCHSRSARISLSYQGLAERSECEGERVTLEDGRQLCPQPPDVHSAAGLACIDCHLHSELMGDGQTHRHQEQAVELRCASCHGPDAPEQSWSDVDDPTSAALLRQHGEARPTEERVRTGVRGTPLWNLRPDGADWALTAKDGRERWSVPQTPHDSAHRQSGHERLSCAACHATWAPTCTTCHTTYDPEGTQWDFAAAAETAGRWHEQSDGFGTAPPVLAVAAERIVPAIPGMIATLEHGADRRPLRLFAPLDPHTTQRAARTCAACHRDGWALGLGTGTLTLTASGPRFTPDDPDPQDPRRSTAGWVTLLPDAPGPSTRANVRSLDATEQRRVLRVGLCVPCHDTADDPIYADFGAARAGQSQSVCGGPVPEAW